MKLPALSTTLLLSLALTTHAADADPTRVLPDGQKPQDARIGKVRTLNDKDFLFTAPANLQDWIPASRALREQVLVANGPGRCRADAAQRGHSRQDRPRRLHDRKSLLRERAGPLRQRQPLPPDGQDQGPLPGVLFPHGH